MFRQGTYGWVLASSNKERLAYGSGPVEGHDPQSFRSEGQGMLSVACFILHLRRWTHHDTPLEGTLATDNSGLITRVKEQSLIRYPVPNSIFQPDWDIVEAIVRTVWSAEIDPTYTLVKGHQDKDNPYETLPFLAQLNVDADKHAGDYRLAHGCHRPMISLSLTRPISLELSGRSIHRNYKSAIRDAAHSGPLLQRLIERNSWQPTVPDTIDWDAHRLATTNPQRRTHFVKLCHDMLPVGKLVHRYSPSYPDWCPLCKNPAEDHKHVLWCTHSSRALWRASFLKKLSEKCKALHTDPALAAILTKGLQHWLHLTPFDEGGIPESYHRLLAEQREIGWYNMFVGRISLQWAVCQSQFLSRSPHLSKNLSGQKWSNQITSFIITNWLDLWDTRNKDRHGRDTKSKQLSLHDQAMRELGILYALKNKVLQRHHSIFDLSLADIQNKPQQYIRQWLNTHQPVILKSIKDAKLMSLLGVRSLPSYFPTQRAPSL